MPSLCAVAGSCHALVCLAHLRLAGTSQSRTSLLGVWMDTATWAPDLLQSSLSWGISPTVDTVSCR